MKILVLACSLRKDSLNKKLAKACYSAFENLGANAIELLDLTDFNIPLYNGDLEKPEPPVDVLRLADNFKDVTHLIVSSPEYNGSMSPVAKNMIDWLSRTKNSPWSKTKVLLLGASPGALGAVRGLIHTQAAFQMAGAHVWPKTFGLSKAHEKFDSSGSLQADELEKVKSFTKEFLGL